MSEEEIIIIIGPQFVQTTDSASTLRSLADRIDHGEKVTLVVTNRRKGDLPWLKDEE